MPVYKEGGNALLLYGGAFLKKYIGLEEMSHVNCSSVLNVIRNCGSVSRKQISDITGLSWGGMTKIVNKLFDHGYIVEEKEEKTAGAGRTPCLIRINEKRNVVIGLDINREGFGACVMNLCGEVLEKYTEEITYTGKDELLCRILAFAEKVVKDYQEKNVCSMGIAMQGTLDVEKGISTAFPHCPDWKEIPIKQMIEQKFGMDVFVEHDPNCMLYSNLLEEESENMLLFRLDRSIGMAASVNGEVLRGNGLLEVTHCIVVPGGKSCRCGKKGCMEAYLAPCMDKDKVNEGALQELLEPLSVFIYNMTRVFHSDTVVLTGKLVRHRALFEERLLESIYQYCDRDEVKIKFLDEADLAVEGAALVALQGAIERVKI